MGEEIGLLGGERVRARAPGGVEEIDDCVCGVSKGAAEDAGAVGDEFGAGVDVEDGVDESAGGGEGFEGVELESWVRGRRGRCDGGWDRGLRRGGAVVCADGEVVVVCGDGGGAHEVEELDFELGCEFEDAGYFY